MVTHGSDAHSSAAVRAVSGAATLYPPFMRGEAALQQYAAYVVRIDLSGTDDAWAAEVGQEGAAASEALYAHSEPRAERYDTARAGTVAGGAQLCGCRLCGAAILPPRRTFCCDECAPSHPLAMAPLTMTPLACAVRSGCSPTRRRCVHFHLLRTSGAHIRKALALRDDKRFAP